MKIVNHQAIKKIMIIKLKNKKTQNKLKSHF